MSTATALSTAKTLIANNYDGGTVFYPILQLNIDGSFTYCFGNNDPSQLIADQSHNEALKIIFDNVSVAKGS